MSQQSDYRYDVFISHSTADEEWVSFWLMPRLEGAGLRVAARYRDSVAGMPTITNIERMIQASRRTVAVITPDWLRNDWNALEDVLVRTLDPAARKRKLIPILLKTCDDLPASLAQLDVIDLRAERRWVEEMKRLTRDLADEVPVALPWQQDKMLSASERWRRWLRRYRRQIRVAVAGVVLLWLLLALIFHMWPFQRRPGWQSLNSRPFDQAWRFSRAGDVLLVSSKTDFDNSTCKPTNNNTGLWRSTDNGATWTAIPVPELEITRLDGQCDMAAFSGFAVAPAEPLRVYGATFEAGLLRSDDGGLHWRKMDEGRLPSRLTHVAVAPESPNLVLVGAERGGVYRSGDGGSQWQRVDAPGACSSEGTGAALPAGFEVGALAVAPGRLYAGSYLGSGPPGPTDGLYVSDDGGSCWRRLDDAAGRYKYLAIAPIPGSKQVLALTDDFRAIQGNPEATLWLIDENRGQAQGLWQDAISVQALLANGTPPASWFMATDRGQVIHGDLDGNIIESTPLLLSCVLNLVSPTSCETALVPDPAGAMPLLLAHDRVYRRGIVSWVHSIWSPD